MSSSARAALALLASLVLTAAAADARPIRRPAASAVTAHSSKVAFMGFLHDARVATVYADGRVRIAPPRATTPADRRTRLLAAIRQAHSPALRTTETHIDPAGYGSLDGPVPPLVRSRVLFDLEHPAVKYAPGRVVVVFKSGVTMPQDHAALTPAATSALVRGVLARGTSLTPHAFTTDARTNATLMRLGVDRMDRLFAGVDRGSLSAMRGRAEARTRRSLLAFDNAFVVHASASSVENAVRALRASPSVAYAAPDYAVSPMLGAHRPVPADVQREISGFRRTAKTFGRAVKSVTPSAVPSNSAVSFNLQAMLGATGVDAVAAFDEIGRAFGQLPGAGEIITNVGLGDVYDASAVTNPNDPCQPIAQGFGPTTRLIGGQHFLDWPSMPLIPAWVSDANGTLSASGESCGVDPNLFEVGLDFSVMAPLPHEQQRAGEVASIGTDLLGIAPGASYRWVAPGTTTGAVASTDTLGALIGAARQVPAPNVITASIGFGADAFGFPGRYLEDDPLSQSVVASIVASGIVVCIAANDGTRLFQLSAVGPSGGSAPTVAGTTGFTTLDDVFLSTTPSVIPDSGAIDVGASTLDDILTVNPQDATGGALAQQAAFTETRYNGQLGFSSGFGSRVNVSAPGDNIESLFKADLAADAVGTEIAGGTSASAPEVAAAAAVAMQVARLTGHPFTTATAVRDALAATGTPVANPPQSDVPANVGPQVSVRRLVEQLLAAGGKPVQPGIARVAVHGRRSGSFIAQTSTGAFSDSTYITALDPAFIKLDGPFTLPSAFVFRGSDTGADLNSYITIAPDWEAVPANATFRLTVTGQPSRVIATAPRVRMLPAQLFAAAGVPLTPGASRTLSLTYAASVGLHVVAESTFQLTFGPPAPSSRLVLAPIVPPVASGSAIHVAYDVRAYPSALARAPVLNVSLPGAGNAIFRGGLPALFSTPLSSTHGTVDVPVAALAGGGTYAIWIDMQPGTFASDLSDFAFVRVDAGTARPPAPLLSAAPGQPSGHTLVIPYKSTFAVSYDVSNVPRATGAIVELSAPPPAPNYYASLLHSGLNTVRNPNGSRLDDDGVVSGSIYHVPVSGTTGTVTIDPQVAGIPATAQVNVRVLPTSGGVPFAEASDVGTLRYLGIEPVLGVPIGNAYLNPNGTDGYLTEGAAFGTAQTNAQVTAYEPFDLTAGTVSGIGASFTGNELQFFPPVQNGVTVAEDAADNVSMAYFRAVPLEAPLAQFSFPPGTFGASSIVLSAATNSSATRSAYLGIDLTNGAFTALAGDVTTGTFSAPVDVTAALGPNADAQGIFSVAYDPSADRAYVLNEDATLPCDQQSPQLVTIDFGTGTAASVALPVGGGETGLGDGYQMAIDPTTHVAAVATSCEYADATRAGGEAFRAELSMVDLRTGSVSRVFQHLLDLSGQSHGVPAMIGGDSATVGIDPVNHLVLQRSMFCPDLVSTFDVNARPCLAEYDEHGTLVKTVPRLFTNGFIDFAIVFNGVNGTTRTGIADGQQGDTFFIESFDVQPYTY